MGHLGIFLALLFSAALLARASALSASTACSHSEREAKAPITRTDRVRIGQSSPLAPLIRAQQVMQLGSAGLGVRRTGFEFWRSGYVPPGSASLNLFEPRFLFICKTGMKSAFSGCSVEKGRMCVKCLEEGWYPCMISKSCASPWGQTGSRALISGFPVQRLERLVSAPPPPSTVNLCLSSGSVSKS